MHRSACETARGPGLVTQDIYHPDSLERLEPAISGQVDVGLSLDGRGEVQRVGSSEIVPGADLRGTTYHRIVQIDDEELIQSCLRPLKAGRVGLLDRSNQGFENREPRRDHQGARLSRVPIQPSSRQVAKVVLRLEA